MYNYRKSDGDILSNDEESKAIGNLEDELFSMANKDIDEFILKHSQSMALTQSDDG